MTCKSCGFENSGNSKFCRRCGASLKTPQEIPKAPAEAQKSDKPEGRRSGKQNSYSRLIFIILAVVFILLTDVVLGVYIYPLINSPATVKYSFKEFSISMEPDMIVDYADRVSISAEAAGISGTVSFAWYGYHSSDDNGFLAFVSDKCSRDYIAYARENPGAVTSEIQRQLLQINLLSEYPDNDGEQLRLEDDMIFFNGKVDSDNMYFAIREIIKDDRIYSFCFFSDKSKDDTFKSWLGTVELTDGQ